jgi:hypothetical protein
MFAYAAWPLQFWRFDPMTERDFDWFESKYPGWYGLYGKFWEEYRRMCDPANGTIPLSLFESLPPVCRVCHMPCILPRPDLSAMRVREHGGRKHALCSDACEEFFLQEPHRYQAAPTFFEEYDGIGLADFIQANGLLRADGKTLMAQPWLNEDRMWTIDDIRALNIVIRDPLHDLPAEART